MSQHSVAASSLPAAKRRLGLDLRIGPRLYLLIAGMLVILAIVMGVSLRILHTSILQEKEGKLESLVEVGLSTLEHYGKQAQDGRMTLTEAQAAAKRAISDLRFEGSNYLFVLTTDMRMLVQPMKPELEGKDVSEVKDSNGVYVLRDLVNLAQRDDWGYLHYLWPKAGSPKPVAKLSTARLYGPWGWVIGTGIYTSYRHKVTFLECLKVQFE